MPSNNRLRIIGGQWRSRSIECCDGAGMRPTPNRVREMLFNWLGSKVYKAVVLDAFAGSGALGIEALSRGADSATFFETQRAVAQKLQKNLAGLEADNAIIYQQDFFKFQNTEQQQFDLVFLDPPFQQGALGRVLHHLLAINCLKSNALIYCEHEASLSTFELPEGLELVKTKKTGDVISVLSQYMGCAKS